MCVCVCLFVCVCLITSWACRRGPGRGPGRGRRYARKIFTPAEEESALRAYNWTRSLAIDGFSVAAVADAVAAG